MLEAERVVRVCWGSDGLEAGAEVMSGYNNDSIEIFCNMHQHLTVLLAPQPDFRDQRKAFRKDLSALSNG